VSRDPASYRDPAGHVHVHDREVYRSVSSLGLADYSFVKKLGVLDPLIRRGWVIGAEEVPNPGLPGVAATDLILRHPRVSPITYPWEWSFGALKSAALLHLDLHLEVLKKGVTFVDASAFNLQFIGARPIFIDYLSFRAYAGGEPWRAHGQFCAQFLNPLVLQAKLDMPFQPWWRGRIDGIDTESLASLLKPWHWLSPVLMSHVLLPARLQRRLDASALTKSKATRINKLQPNRFRAILLQLRNYIAALEPARAEATTWSGYPESGVYSDE